MLPIFQYHLLGCYLRLLLLLLPFLFLCFLRFFLPSLLIGWSGSFLQASSDSSASTSWSSMLLAIASYCGLFSCRCILLWHFSHRHIAFERSFITSQGIPVSLANHIAHKWWICSLCVFLSFPPQMSQL